MNNHIKTLANGDFEVIPLDDPKAQEFAKRRNYHYTNTTNPIDFPTIQQCPYDEWKSDNITLD